MTVPEFHIISHGSSSPSCGLDEIDATLLDEHPHQKILHHKRIELDAEFASGSRIGENDGDNSAP